MSKGHNPERKRRKRYSATASALGTGADWGFTLRCGRPVSAEVPMTVSPKISRELHQQTFRFWLCAKARHKRRRETSPAVETTCLKEWLSVTDFPWGKGSLVSQALCLSIGSIKDNTVAPRICVKGYGFSSIMTLNLTLLGQPFIPPV